MTSWKHFLLDNLRENHITSIKSDFYIFDGISLTANTYIRQKFLPFNIRTLGLFNDYEDSPATLVGISKQTSNKTKYISEFDLMF